MYGLPEQPFKLTMRTSASVVALMKATPSPVPTLGYVADEPAQTVDFAVE